MNEQIESGEGLFPFLWSLKCENKIHETTDKLQRLQKATERERERRPDNPSIARAEIVIARLQDDLATWLTEYLLAWEPKTLN